MKPNILGLTYGFSFLSAFIMKTRKEQKMKRTELKTRLASLMVYLELRECTNARTFISYRDLEKRLEEKYGKELRPSKNTIYEILREMVDRSEELGVDIIRGNSRQGYALRNREFEEWEIDLFVEVILNSKTLSAVDKKNLIDKCFNYLGPVSEKRMDEIYDYLFGKSSLKVKNKAVEKPNVEETLEMISSAINSGSQIDVEILYHQIGYDKTYTAKIKRTIHPYRVFERNNISYLVYGQSIKDRMLVLYDKIDNINVLRIKKDKAVPIESINEFKKGIDEKRLRKDPFGYLTQSDKEILVAESLIDDEKTARIAKREVEEFFKGNVTFYHDKEKDYIYINDDFEKNLNWFLLHSKEYRIISPESMVQLMKTHTANMYKTYLDGNSEIKKYQDERTAIEYMYRNKRTYLTK